MLMSARRVLVLAAHPDDAELSVGGTIAKLRHQGAEVSVANFTISEATAELRERRRRVAEAAAEILGHRLIWVEDGRYDQVEDIVGYRLVSIIDQIVATEQPDVVIGPWVGDSHLDHIHLSRALLSSSRRWTADLYACCPGEFRTPCYHRFEPNVFVDISAFVEQKLAAIRVFNYAGQNFRHLEQEILPRLWEYYGALSGYKSAEGLLLLRARWG